MSAPGPTEIPTLAGALDDMRGRGFGAQFTLAAGRLRARAGTSEGTSYSPDEVEIVEEHRFEGVSDPDDMAVVYGLEARGGLRGTLVDAFGVYADPAVGEFMRAVALRHGGPREVPAAPGPRSL
jgi:hypothetical protein